MKTKTFLIANRFVDIRTPNNLIWGFLLTLALFFICRGLIYGQLRLLEQKNNAIPFSHVAWAGPEIALKNQGINHLNIKGHSPHPQTVILYCSDCSSIRSYRIKSGFFEIDYSLNDCVSDSLTIKSDYSFIPASGIGSKDSRVLSYQIGLVSLNNGEITLIDFIKSAHGMYGLEQQFNRITADEILSFTWDSMWYWRIAAQDYSYDGNPLVQQNVNWPFLYPYLSKIFSFLFSTSISGGMLSISAFGLFFTLFGLFYLGHQLHLSFWPACVAPVWVALNPFVFFLIGGFSESLFMMLLIGTLILLLRKKWFLSATAIAVLGSTRFVGAAAVVLLCTYWIICQHQSVSPSRKILTICGLIGISTCGILLDMAIKWHLTGSLFSGFLVRRAWNPRTNTFLDSIKDIFHIDQIYRGEYLPILIIIMILVSIAIVGSVHQIKEKNYSNALVTSSGAFLVLLTWLINPDLYAFGRYSLPLAPSIVGLLSSTQTRERYMSIILSLTAIGSGFIGIICTRLYFGYSPL